MNDKMGTFFELLTRIDDLRHLMITAAQQHGLGSPETLRYSKQLDELILQYLSRNR